MFIGNAVAVVAISTGLGFGAYRKYAAGELSWKVVGAWTGVVGLFAAGDYYLSQYVGDILDRRTVVLTISQIPLQEQIPPKEVEKRWNWGVFLRLA